MIDKAILDIKVSRQRYEGASRVQTRMLKEEERDSDANSGETALPDPFDHFRTQTLDPAMLSKVTLESGTYTQVPSRFAATTNLISVYSVANKSDIPGESHMGTSVDTRFGNAGPARMAEEFGTLEQHQRREGARYRLRKHNEELDCEEVRRTYIPRTGRQVYSTTGLYRPTKSMINRQRMVNAAYRNSQSQGTAASSPEGGAPIGLNGKQTVQNVENSVQSAAAEGNNMREKGVRYGPSKVGGATKPDPTKVLVGSASFGAPTTRNDGFPPYLQNIHRPIHPGQQFTNRLFAEQQALLERQRLLARNKLVTANQVKSSGKVPVNQAPSAYAADGRVGYRPGSVPGVILSYESAEHALGTHPSQYLNGPFVASMHGGMPMPNPSMRLPDFGQMLAGEGFGGQDMMYMGNMAGVHNYGLRGPMAHSMPEDQLFQHSQFGAREMEARVDTPTPLRGGYSSQDMNMMQMGFGNMGLDDPYVDQGMLGSQPMNGAQGMVAPAPQVNKPTRRGQRSNRALAQKADQEYARFMDEMNQESRKRGDTILAGDMLTGHAQAQVRFNLQPPSPLPKGTDEGVVLDEGGVMLDENDKKSEKVEREEQQAWSDLMQSPERVSDNNLNPAVFDAGSASFMVPPKRGPHLLAASRPATQSPQVPILQDGRNSVPPRTRPTLLSPIEMLSGQGRGGTPMDLGVIRERLAAENNLIFGEKPGSVSSRNPSPAPDGIHRSASMGRRLYEK